MIYHEDLRQYVIEPTLLCMTQYNRRIDSESAQNLMLWIAIAESVFRGDMRLQQLNDGPAMGIWQMEPTTHDDIWATFIYGRFKLAGVMRELAIHKYTTMVIPANEVRYNLMYACAMARLKLWRVPEPLPDAWDIPEMARYWKEHYNANPDNFESDINRFIDLAQETLT